MTTIRWLVGWFSALWRFHPSDDFRQAVLGGRYHPLLFVIIAMGFMIYCTVCELSTWGIPFGVVPFSRLMSARYCFLVNYVVY